MDDQQLNQLLCKMDSGIKVPNNLAAKISGSVAVRAGILEKRRVIWSAAKLAGAILVAIYGLTAAIVSLMQSSVSAYIATFFDSPGVFFSSNGMQAVIERLPFFSLLIAIGAGIYVFRHLAIKGLRKNPYVFATAMSVLGVVVMTGMFVAGMAIGVNSDEEVQNMAGTALFEPLLADSVDTNYSLVGKVVSVGDLKKDGNREITLKLADDEQRIIQVSDEMLKQELGRPAQPGDNLLIFGKPEMEQDARLKLKNENMKPPIQVDYLRVLTN